MRIMKMTIKEAKEICSKIGMTLKKNEFDTNEFIVNYKGSSSIGSAYYTTDLNDAVKTAKDMHARYQNLANSVQL